jgi:hypothetical protein
MLRYSFGNINGKAYGLNANELSVYEAIGKCSRKDDARGWYADMQTLANQLPHRVNRSTVSRAVDKLLTLGLIRRDGKSLFAVQIAREDVQNAHGNVQNANVNVQNAQNPAPPLYPPINNNNEMEKENTRTLVPTHEAAKPETPFWSDIKMAFKEKGGQLPTGIIDSIERSAFAAWQQASPAKKIKLLAAVREGKFFKPRIDWLITDFPEPQPIWKTGGEKDEDLVQVFYNGTYKICTRDTMELFGLQWVRDW